MHLSRLKSGSVILLILLIVFGLGTSCGDEKSKAQFVRVPCSGNLTVYLDPTATTPVNPPDIYLCKNDTVTWKPASSQPSLEFKVFFKKKGECPLDDCTKIDQNHQTPRKMAYDDKQPVKVYDYGVVMNDQLFDPHVVGGGG